MQRHLEPVADQVRELYRNERADRLAAEDPEHLSRQLVGPMRALARNPDARAVERLCEIVHDGVIPGGLDRDRNVRGFPAPQERADLAERRDDHHPDEDDEKRERVRIAAEDRRGERASSWALALVRQ